MDYFRNLFSSSGSESVSEALEGLMPRVTNQMNSELTRQITSEEVKAVVLVLREIAHLVQMGCQGIFTNLVGIL